MTGEELRRFALQLREAERLRARIAKDEAVARAGSGDELPLPAALPAEERPPRSAVLAA